jgi:hypothetical protein
MHKATAEEIFWTKSGMHYSGVCKWRDDGEGGRSLSLAPLEGKTARAQDDEQNKDLYKMKELSYEKRNDGHIPGEPLDWGYNELTVINRIDKQRETIHGRKINVPQTLECSWGFVERVR